ncbi:hypothetical protein [Myxosarcina sp. GI1]|uniref:hypothetical protein n=1 Tax=Myxosarcina sp. GI1 TaxID=1541065 RepID=UPI00055F6653|nr:hypothetical protein [Myxosarcina sp. GI1]
MDNNQSSEIISNNETQNEILQNDSPETVLETQPISVTNSEHKNSLELKKWAIVGCCVVLTIAAYVFLSKETDTCLFSTCSEYSYSSGDLSVGNEFLIYAGSAATLVGLTFVGVPLLPAIAVSTGIWFFVHLVR